MRIAYVVPYQGAALLNKRPTVLNRSLSQSLKVELIASLLRASDHDVEIISQGEVVEHTLKFFPAFSEAEPFHPGVSVHYASAWPVPRVNGFWSNSSTLRLLKARHLASPFDLVIIWNLKGPQLACANHAIRQLNLPVILEYEDDHFVDRSGQPEKGLFVPYYARMYRKFFKTVSGCMAVSPHLLSQLPDDIPKMLLRGVVGDDLIVASQKNRGAKKPVVLFSGTHVESNGVEQLIRAWKLKPIPGWELHVTGQGQQTVRLKELAAGLPGVQFHGLVSRERLVELMSTAAICANPHAMSHSPGHLFAFKLIEYLAAGAHVITTPMGALENGLETGITYLRDNAPDTISAALEQVIRDRRYDHTAAQAAHDTYGPAAVARAVDALIAQVSANEQRNQVERPLRRLSPHGRA